MTVNDNVRPALAEMLNYLRTGGLGEVAGLAEQARSIGSAKVTMDTDMAIALTILASRSPSVDEDVERCFICEAPFRAGDMVLPDVTEGLGHRECFGEDRASYVKNIKTGEPLGANDPIPEGRAWAGSDNNAAAILTDEMVMHIIDRARNLLDRITFDSDGITVGMVRQGGNGGLISIESIRAADELRKALDALDRAAA